MDRIADLERRLRSHRPADDAERRHRAALDELLRSPFDPFDRRRHDPGHVTASAYVLSPDRHAVLLVHHRVLDRWLQPGGHVEPSDPDVERAARREVREETGVRALRPLVEDGAPFDVDVHPIPARPGRPGHRHFDVRFLFAAGGQAIESGSDAAAVAWVPLGRLLERDDGPAFRRVRRKLAAV